MKRFFCFLLLSLFFFSSLARAQTSLFFTNQEIETIEDILAQTPVDRTALSPHNLRLDSILFLAPDRWTLWLQGEKWTPETQSKKIKILSVMSDQVRLSVTLESGLVQDFILSPHQSVNLLTGEIAGELPRFP